MRYDWWYRPLATVFGLGPRWTRIRVADGVLRVRHGWAFAIDVPLHDIESVTPVDRRPLARGVHAALDGWLVNGSGRGVVEVRFAQPIKPKRAPLIGWFNRPVRKLYLSVTTPEEFIAAVTSHPLGSPSGSTRR